MVLLQQNGYTHDASYPLRIADQGGAAVLPRDRRLGSIHVGGIQEDGDD